MKSNMEITIEELLKNLLDCRDLISRGYNPSTSSGIPWLDGTCAEFLRFSNDLHKFLQSDNDLKCDDNEKVEIIFLCLTQILTCIRHLEEALKAEQAEGKDILLSRQHFLDRIIWCIDRMNNVLSSSNSDKHAFKADLNIVQLMDRALDFLCPYSSYSDCSITNVAEENAEAMFASKQIRYTIDQFIGHVLAFANVALKKDKQALSALCQKVLRECIAFQDECCLNRKDIETNQSERKLKAMSLESALHQLEEYIDEALLRLVFATFMDYSKFSIDKLRVVMELVSADDTQLDELIADFDVNIDRTTQIGLFAMAFTPDVKARTIVRSCLASLESLDSCIIPALQSNCVAHSEILENHFNEEVRKFRFSIQEIIDSYAFCGSYLQMLSDCIVEMEKNFNKKQLIEIIQMGWVLQEHFQIEINYTEISKSANGAELFQKFTLMLGECQAILMCADQVDHSRIFKRFKICRSILYKFLNSIGVDSSKETKSSNPIMMSDYLMESDPNEIFDSIGITLSQHSILYPNETPRHIARDTLKSNYMKSVDKTTTIGYSKLNILIKNNRYACDTSIRHMNRFKEGNRSVRRKESLRTNLFKKQKSMESENIYKAYKDSTNSLQITDILNQLTRLSSTFSNAILSNERNDI